MTAKYGPELVPGLVPMSLGQQAGGPVSELSHHRAYNGVPASDSSADCSILVFPHQADSKRKMCSQKYDLFYKMLGSVEMTTSLLPCSLAVLQPPGREFPHLHCPWNSARMHSVVGWRSRLLYLSLRLAALFFGQFQLSQRKLVYL